MSKKCKGNKPSSRAAFEAVHRPEDTLAEMRELIKELREEQKPFVKKLQAKLENAGGTRFTTKEQIGEFAALVNEALDRLDIRVEEPTNHEPTRLALHLMRGGEYFCVGFRGRDGRVNRARRVVPENLTLTSTPSLK